METKTFHKKLNEKIINLLSEIGFNVLNNELIKSCDLNELIKQYIIVEGLNVNTISSGKGKRLTQSQKKYKILRQYLMKLLEYEEKENICGENRNSYFKTDKDATAMVLKEDYYSKLSNDFYAGYNIQILVSSGLITMYGVFQDQSD